MKIDTYTRVAYRSILLGCALFVFLKIAIPFPAKWAEFKETDQRRNELQAELSAIEAEAKAIRRNRERFVTDKYFVQKLAHEIGYAHESEVIFQFSVPQNTNGTKGVE